MERQNIAVYCWSVYSVHSLTAVPTAEENGMKDFCGAVSVFAVFYAGLQLPHYLPLINMLLNVIGMAMRYCNAVSWCWLG